MSVYNGERVSDNTFDNGRIWSRKAFGAEGANDSPRRFGRHGQTRYPTTEPLGGAPGYNR